MKINPENQTPDYGCDPLGNGQFRMVPSGDIVNRDERDKRLAHIRQKYAQRQNDCLGKSWDEIEFMQGMKKGTFNKNV